MSVFIYLSGSLPHIFSLNDFSTYEFQFLGRCLPVLYLHWMRILLRSDLELTIPSLVLLSPNDFHGQGDFLNLLPKILWTSSGFRKTENTRIFRIFELLPFMCIKYLGTNIFRIVVCTIFPFVFLFLKF